MTGSTTGPELILFLFFHFPTQLLAYNLEKCLYLVVVPRITTKHRHLYFWHIGQQCDVFSTITGEYPETGTINPKSSIIYHQMRECTNIRNI